VSGPRQAARPRTGAAPRQPAAARRPRGATSGPARASRSPAASASAGPAAEHEPSATARARPLEPPARRSGWQDLLDELNRLLRDPTLTRALKAFLAQLAAGARGLPVAVLDLARGLARALARIRLPRRILLALLALLLPLALLALLTSGDDERSARSAPQQPVRPPATADGGLSLPAVGMPQLVAQPDKVRPVRVALVLDRTYAPPALRRELRSLGAWLADNHAPGTRVSVIDGASARASRPLNAARIARADVTRPRASTAVAIRSALARQGGRRLLVTLGSSPAAPRPARILRIAARPGAATGSATALAQRDRARVTIDDRRPNALAASVARAIMAISGERERR